MDGFFCLVEILANRGRPKNVFLALYRSKSELFSLREYKMMIFALFLNVYQRFWHGIERISLLNYPQPLKAIKLTYDPIDKEKISHSYRQSRRWPVNISRKFEIFVDN